MDLESKTPTNITVRFADDSEIKIAGYDAAYIWLHLKAASDLVPLLYRSGGIYSEGNLSLPIKTLYEEQDFENEQVTR
jgi:hypothetical protein